MYILYFLNFSGFQPTCNSVVTENQSCDVVQCDCVCVGGGGGGWSGEICSSHAMGRIMNKQKHVLLHRRK